MLSQTEQRARDTHLGLRPETGSRRFQSARGAYGPEKGEVQRIPIRTEKEDAEFGDVAPKKIGKRFPGPNF